MKFFDQKIIYVTDYYGLILFRNNPFDHKNRVYKDSKKRINEYIFKPLANKIKKEHNITIIYKRIGNWLDYFDKRYEDFTLRFYEYKREINSIKELKYFVFKTLFNWENSCSVDSFLLDIKLEVKIDYNNIWNNIC